MVSLGFERAHRAKGREGRNGEMHVKWLYIGVAYTADTKKVVSKFFSIVREKLVMLVCRDQREEMESV